MLKDWLNQVFPKFCAVCKKEEDYLCGSCFSKFKVRSFQVCPNCKNKRNYGKFCCELCQKGFYFDQLLVGCEYKEIKKLIWMLKFKFIEDLGKIFAELMIKQFDSVLKNLQLENTLIVPVPLDKSRIAYRGFNQASLIAEQLNLFYPQLRLCDVLKRKKVKIPQVMLKRSERMDNLQKVFVIMDEADFMDRKILLIDDVATTLSTLNECSRILKMAGARSICGLVLARG